MLKTKKKFLLMAILTIVAMLCCGLSLMLSANASGNASTIDISVTANYVSPENVTEWDYEADEQGIVYSFDDPKYSIVGYTDNLSANIVIPSSFNGKQIWQIDEDAFDGCSTIKTITVEDTPEDDYYGWVGFQQFNCCQLSGLDWIWLKCSRVVENVSAFIGETKPIVYVPESMLEDYQESYYWEGFTIQVKNESVDTSVDVGNLKYELNDDNQEATIISLSDNATSVTALVIGASIDVDGVIYSVVAIEAEAFKGCSTIQSVSIPASVASIGQDAFANCALLTDITFGASSNLNSITFGSGSIPSTVTSIHVPTGSESDWQDKLTSSFNAQMAQKVVVPPETGVVLNIILPSLVILMTLIAIIVIWKKKEQY